MCALLLIQGEENSSPQSCFTTGCKQPKISHCVSITIGDMLREDVDKFLIRELQENVALISCMLCTALDTIHSDPRKTMLGNRWSSYVSSIVL
jgi:hypothetical protein